MSDFSDLVDKAIHECKIFMEIDYKFINIPNDISDVFGRIDYFNNLKQTALDHFKSCNNRYCRQIYEYNQRNTHE